MSHASSTAAVRALSPSARAAVALVARSPAVGIVALIGCIDLAWNLQAGLGFVGFTQPATTIACLLGVSLICSARHRLAGLAELAAYLALWIGFTMVGSIATYLAAAASRPLTDVALATFDTSIGFDWNAWVRAIGSLPFANTLLRVLYQSLLPQIVGSIALFSVARIEGRNQELLCAAAIALLPVLCASALFPALGPWVHYNYGETAYLSDVLALRQGATLPFVLSRMQGIVTFPSYHTVLALLFVYVHRGIPASFPVVAVLNGVMLLSVPSVGGHYLVDMLGGALVAAFAIGLARMLRHTNGSAAPV